MPSMMMGRRKVHGNSLQFWKVFFLSDICGFPGVLLRLLARVIWTYRGVQSIHKQIPSFVVYALKSTSTLLNSTSWLHSTPNWLCLQYFHLQKWGVDTKEIQRLILEVSEDKCKSYMWYSLIYASYALKYSSWGRRVLGTCYSVRRLETTDL